MTSRQKFQIIGIDCAADPEDIGIAFARTDGDLLLIDRVLARFRCGTKDRTERIAQLAKTITDEVMDDRPTLFALDAPLGWPVSMSNALRSHEAGSSSLLDLPLVGHDDLFRRETDRVVMTETGKKPLEIGADRISRVTHTALRLAGRLASHPRLTTTPIADPTGHHESILIEVYPALAGPFFLSPKSKATTGRDYWNNIAKKLGELKEEAWPAMLDRLQRCQAIEDTTIDTGGLNDKDKKLRDHGFDAILCAWTGFRFLQGKCVPPRGIPDNTLTREGWIWFDERVGHLVRLDAPGIRI